MNVEKSGDNEVSCCIDPGHFLMSYPGVLHGGIISLLFDGVMTNCLFSADIPAVTARLEVRYLHPVEIGREILIKARRVKSKAAFHHVKAELSQDGVVKTTASASFLKRK